MSNFWLLFAEDFPRGKLNLPDPNTDGSAIADILKYIFAIIGALSVLMIVIAGVRYIVSSGNPQNTALARNAIIYSIVGLIVSLSAFAIVDFIFDRM